MYKDQIYKLEYYKQKLIDQSLSYGEYLKPDSLKTLLEEYDFNFALFKHKYIKEGAKFNVDDFNNELSILYNDLSILYRIVYELTITEFNKTKEMVNIKLDNLNQIANQYYNRCKLETIAILGDTLVYQANNFDITNKNGKSYIKLPSFSTYAGASLAFLANLDMNNSNAILELSPSENISNYENNENLYVVPGKSTIKTHFITLDPQNKYKGSFMLDYNPDNSYRGQYYLYAGKNMIKVADEYIDIGKYNRNEYPDEYEVELYVYNGTSIDFNFTLEPISSNINNKLVTIKNRIQRFVFKMPAYSHISFNTNGIIFCAVEECLTKNNRLYSKRSYDNVYEYMLESVIYDTEVKYENPVVVIDNSTAEHLKINSLAVKQNRYNQNDQLQY